jgi:hypothetical protein
MVAHRKNVPAPRAHVPSTWFIVLTVMIVVGCAGWLGWLVLDDDPDPSETVAPPLSSSTAPAPSATPTTSAPTTRPTPDPDPSSEPTPAPTRKPVAQRTATVSVLNNSGIVGAARTFSAKVTGAGWRLGGIGNWTGSIAANTVYYPPGLQDQAQRLAADVGIQRVRPAVAPMRSDRLTIILSGAQ